MKKKFPSQSVRARRSIREGGFFNLRVFGSVLARTAGVCLALTALAYEPVAFVPAPPATSIVVNPTSQALAATPEAATLSNLSARSFVQTGDNVMIGGFVVQGPGTKRVIIRAIGPELSQYGVPTPLADPTLELHDGTGALIGFNNDWQHTVIGGIITRDQVQDIINSGHAPGDPLESAIIADLPTGNYTAIVRAVNIEVGTALVEVYDLSGSQ